MRKEKITPCVVCESSQRLEQATAFARLHEMELFASKDDDYTLQLIYGDGTVSLYDSTLDTSIHVDFLEGTLAHREKFGGGKGQAIAKAIGLNKIKEPAVVDITAGLARDAYVLATLGCRLTLVEQSPVLSALIQDGIDRASASDAEHSVDNISEIVNADSLQYLQQMDEDIYPDVIYMDPMYPERKKSALVKKDMQILHKLIGISEQEDELLETAIQRARHRVVVKRPAHAEPVEGIEPTMSISSKKTRYDVYVVAAL